MSTEEHRSVVVVPCFNEQGRLDPEGLSPLFAEGSRVLFVDDGSSDRTLELLRHVADTEPGVDVLVLPQNLGKAEAVRRGLLRAIEGGAEFAGYLDADLSTRASDYQRLLAILSEDASLDVVLGARVALLGHHIQRRAVRHYLGRVFGTLASASLGLPVYDTQCGAKVFRATPSLTAALQQPFRSRWVFDVELIGRLNRGTNGSEPVPVEAFREVPLESWVDIPGSSLSLRQMSTALIDLAFIAKQQQSSTPPRRRQDTDRSNPHEDRR